MGGQTGPPFTSIARIKLVITIKGHREEEHRECLGVRNQKIKLTQRLFGLKKTRRGKKSLTCRWREGKNNQRGAHITSLFFKHKQENRSCSPGLHNSVIGL